MKRAKMESIDMTKENIEKIGALFPNVITEMKGDDGKLKKGINFELLKQELMDDVVDGEECYDFTWVGKKAAIVEGNTPIRKTLRPCIEESKDWETTQNLYIEGDNLDVLKLLQESYLNSVKMIYIDPPYNTGNDFVYRDDFKTDKDDYDEQKGLFDEEENRLFKNTETNGRFHSDWCSMMYPRLKLASNLLRDDGLIFISIDDNEVDNLRKICDEIMGSINFIGMFAWRKKVGAGADSKLFFRQHEYTLLYSKDIYSINYLYQSLTEEQKKEYSNPDNDKRGLWAPTDLSAPAHDNDAKRIYEVVTPSGKVYKKCWAYTQENMKKLLAENLVWFGKNGDSMPKRKRFLSEKLGLTPRSWIDSILTSDGKKDIVNLGLKGIFDYPKPIKLIENFLDIGSQKDSVILDFFSGSATTAHAVMQLNAEDGGNRKFIMVQLPEKCDEKSEAYKAGYKNISEIGKERIRRAGDKINKKINDNNAQLKIGEEAKPKVDIGFRVLKVDSTNMKDVYYAANEYNQQMLAELETNIKEDRTDLDLLYGVLLDWGLPLSLNHRIEKIENTTVHFYDCPVVDAQLSTSNCSLAACFEDKVSESVVREIAKRQPLRVVFRDRSFADSPGKINVEEIFKLLAPNTSVKVI